MPRAITALCFALVLASQARADTQAQILSIEPADSRTLVENERFYVRVQYATDQPVNLWAHPYFKGKPVRRMLAATSSRYLGKGEVVGWFTLTEPGKVDEIRIVAGGGDPWRQWSVAARRLNLRWVAEQPQSQPHTAAAHPPAEVAPPGPMPAPR